MVHLPHPPGRKAVALTNYQDRRQFLGAAAMAVAAASAASSLASSTRESISQPGNNPRLSQPKSERPLGRPADSSEADGPPSTGAHPS
jgi:hypothetical protein